MSTDQMVTWAKLRFEQIKPILLEMATGAGMKRPIRVCLVPPAHPDIAKPDENPSYRSAAEANNPLIGHARALYDLLASEGYAPVIRPYRSDIAYTVMQYESHAMYMTELPGARKSNQGSGYYIVAQT